MTSIIDSINFKTLREARLFLKVAKDLFRERIIQFPCDISNIESIKFSIFSLFNDMKSSYEEDEIIKSIKIIKSQIACDFVSNLEIKKITTNERIGYYSFMYLKKIFPIENKIYPELMYQPENIKCIKKYIECKIDSLDKTKGNTIELINNINLSFRMNTKNYPDPLKWIDKKNKKQCDWIYDYTQQFIQKMTIPPSNFIFHQSAQTSEEKYLFSIGSFDQFNPEDPEIKKDYLRKSRNAWRQKLLRENHKSKNTSS